MIVMTAFSIFVNFYHKYPSLLKAAGNFMCKNICKKHEGGSSGGGVNKGLIRFLDTLGTLCALTGLILGISSLFIEQYEFSFEPQGKIKEVIYTVYYGNQILFWEVRLNHSFRLPNNNLCLYTGH